MVRVGKLSKSIDTANAALSDGVQFRAAPSCRAASMSRPSRDSNTLFIDVLR